MILVRHPRPIAAPGLCYGGTDLAAEPGDTARVLAELRNSLPAQVPLFSSPLQRCAVLASALSPLLRAPLRFDARLAEMDFGDWEMRSWDAIARAEIDAWSADLAHYRPGGGENVLEMAARVGAFRQALLGMPDRVCIVVCHAGTMRLLAAWDDGLNLEEIALKAASASHRIGYGERLVLDC